MAEKKLKVYACPFCRAEVWFSNIEGLARHLEKEHLQETCEYLAKLNMIEVLEEKENWFRSKSRG